jgi:predicted nucleic acid-binding protein
MTKLNQIIAIEKGIKSRTHSEFSDLYKAAQRAELFNGFSKTYQTKDEDGETLPPENKRVQYTTDDVLRSTQRTLSELFNVTARKDFTNCVAKATVTLNETILVKDAPVSYLLFLEKQLTDLRTFISALPVLDAAEKWTKDTNSGLYKTDVVQTHRSKKIAKPIVLYPATDKHPAQTQIVTEDVLAGYWNQVKQSGAMPLPEKQELLERLETLLHAIKQAREEANGSDEVETPPIGEAVFNYLLGA